MLGELSGRIAATIATANAASVPTSSNATAASASIPVSPPSVPATADGSNGKFNLSFEAGKVFSKFDRGDGKIDKQSFERILLDHPELLSASYAVKSESKDRAAQAQAQAQIESQQYRTVTHYDETAGVAIPATSVTAHQAMGNSVLPLTESYNVRYNRLRTLLTAKLLPKREYLLQLRRELCNTSAEVEAAKDSIERETLEDAQQILDRLRTVEALRQSAIKHQIVQLDKELQMIDRIVQRIDAASQITPLTNGGFSGVSIVGAGPNAIPISGISGNTVNTMVDLIQQFNDLSVNIDKLSAKQINVQVDFPIDDFPKETAERLEIVAKCDKYLHAIAVKDQMLWAALQDKKKCEEELAQERQLSQEYAQEIASWAELSQGMAAQVNSLKGENDGLKRKVAELESILRQHNIFTDLSTTPRW
jgi:hypothetical protein